MSEKPEVPDTIQFGAFDLNARSGELRKFGTRLKLQQQPLQILQILLERPGELVTREAIRERLWPDGIFVDFENAINSAVRKLRDALGDSAENPRFVETLSRRGYRFIAPVRRVPPAASAPVIAESRSEARQPEAPPSPSVEPVRPRSHWAVLPLLLTVTGVVAVAIAMRVETPSPAQHFRVVPFSSYLGAEMDPAISRDGTRVAFAWNGPAENNLDIYVKAIGSGDPLRLTTDPATDRSPAWSPDGQWIAFLREVSEDESALMLAPSLGGAEVELTRIGLSWLSTWALHGRLLTWSADGKSIFTIHRGPERAYNVVNVSVATRESRTVATSATGTIGASALSLSPDGQMLAFTRTTAYQPRQLFILSLSRDIPAREIDVKIANAADGPCALDWTPDGREIVFSTCGGGIWRQAIAGSGKPVRLAGIDTGSTDLTIARTGHRMIFSQGGADENIWRLDLENVGGAPAKPFIASTRRDGIMTYSPDGRKIAFESNRSGAVEIWVCNHDGSSPLQLTSFGTGWSGSPAWSPDGKSVAFDRSDPSSKWKIYVVGAQGGKPRQIVSDATNNVAPGWSRDGKWIYFSSDKTGRYEVWRIPSTGGAQAQVTSESGMAPQESSNGAELYFQKGQGQRGALWKKRLSDGLEGKVLDSVYNRQFALVPGGVYYVNQGGPSAQLRYLDFRSGRDTKLRKIFASCPGLAVSPDARWLLFAQVDVVSGDLVLVENFE